MNADDVTRTMQTELDAMEAERDVLEERIARYRAALQALNGERPGRRAGSPSAGTALLAALATFDVPVKTERLLDHPDLVHYSRHTLRSALSELHHRGRVSGTRGPKGFIWEPQSVRDNGAP